MSPTTSNPALSHEIGTNRTATEFITYNTQRYPERRRSLQTIELNIVKPLLDESVDEVAKVLEEKLERSPLQAFLVQPHADVARALNTLHDMLSLSSVNAQLNRRDRVQWTPLDYATTAFPEAVVSLLQAGASLKVGACLLHQYGQDQWKAVSPLIRAGYSTEERYSYDLHRSALHFNAASHQPNYRHALELVRHGGHLLDWDALDDDGCSPLDLANQRAAADPDDEQRQLVCALYRSRRIPPHAQYISSFDGERLMDEEEASLHPRVSLIDAGLVGDVGRIGQLISAGAMVNERDAEGRTLLHLIALGNRIPNAYLIALELVRHGGMRGVDWGARVPGLGLTAQELIKQTLQRGDLDMGVRRDTEQVRSLIENERLPAGQNYMFACMDPNFCRNCGLLRCICPENDVPGMPGSFC